MTDQHALRGKMIDLINQLGEAIQRFDDAAVTRGDDPRVDELRDAANELHYRLVTRLVEIP